MDERQIIDAIAGLARDAGADALSESMISLTHGELFEAALDTFGSWDVALASALEAALVGRLAATVSKPTRTSVSTERPTPPTRAPDRDANRPVIALTANGYVVRVSADTLFSAWTLARPSTPANWPDDIGLPTAFFDLDASSGIAALSGDGRLFGWDSRLVPGADFEGARRLGARYDVERWVALDDRDTVGLRPYVFTVSARGKIKSSESELLPRPLFSEGTIACLVGDGDTLVSLLTVGGDDTIMLVSSNGYAIVFHREEVRPMGLRATGVKGIDLRRGARVIGAIQPQRHSEIAVISRRGYAKRMFVDEFRPQSRAGLGLVAAKNARHDELSAVTGCDANSDLLVTTSLGRCLRLPAESVPAMGRQARGNQVILLDDNEDVVQIARLLPMDMAFE